MRAQRGVRARGHSASPTGPSTDRVPDAMQHAVLLRRAGTQKPDDASQQYGPGSAAHRRRDAALRPGHAWGIEARSFHTVIASEAKQSRNLSAAVFWIASLRSQ